MGDSEKSAASRFYLYVGPGDLSPSNVFFEVEDEVSARDLCRLFADEYGTTDFIAFNYKTLPDDAISEDVRLCEALDGLWMYDDPDPGVYDPRPSRQTLVRAAYCHRAQIWADLIQQRRAGEQKAAALRGLQSDQNTAGNADVQVLESTRRLLEKHRLMFLYFAVPKRINPRNHNSQWETLRADKFPKIPCEDIDSEGDFLFVHRRKFETFAQNAVREFGTGLGNKPSIMIASGEFVDVEGSSYPFWMLDETACVHLDESADTILEACRNAVRHGADRLLSRFVPRIKMALHDEGQSKWYASKGVQWSYLMRLDDVLHALKLAEFENCSVSEDQQPPNDEKEGDASHEGNEKATDVSELPGISDIPLMPEEEDRNSGLYLLEMLAQAYYKMLEATVSIASCVTAHDMELNRCYLWTIHNLAYLLKNHKHLRDFPGCFEPALPDLYPSTIANLEWQDMIAPGVEDFLATVQKYVIAKGCYQPKENTTACNVIEDYRTSIERAIEIAENHHKRLRQTQRRLPGVPMVTKAGQSKGSRAATWPAFPTPKDAKWTDVSIQVVDAETVAIKLGDHTRRYIYSEMGMIDGRTKRPTKQWELLRIFAESQGTLTWEKAGASRKNQKRREVLSDNLKAFFGIEGEPIVLTDDKKGWSTTFSIGPGT